ncbi:MAG: C4-dicarboxylate transporter, partial [Chloroflexi bacterium]|nr:C4-dicarboxylate transporter [Chloroflexota bacterium]
GAIGAFILAIIKRRMSFSALVGSLKSSILTTCFILTLYTGAMIFSNFLALGHFSSLFRDWINSLPFSHHAIMIIILFLYIPLGMFMDGLAMLLLTLPIVFPIVKAFGFDPVWFGIIVTLLVEMALLSPPVGLNSYVVHGVTKVPLQDVFYGIAPFFGMMFLCLALLYAFPAITLFLPNTVGIGAR